MTVHRPLAILVGVASTMGAAPAFAQQTCFPGTPPICVGTPPQPYPFQGTGTSSGGTGGSSNLSTETTPIGDLIKNDQAKAALEKALPQISQFYDQISTMTLSQVAPMSQGALDDAKLKELQAEFDKIK